MDAFERDSPALLLWADHDACGSCKGCAVSTGNVVAGLTCCELSGEELGLAFGLTDLETI